MYGTDMPQCASNLIGVSALAFAEQIVEISFRAVLDGRLIDQATATPRTAGYLVLRSLSR
ncbi:hypothetical protein RLEG12_09585 (plasmid) [Rhizobium leguminosarum bv. trifolii CB782]|nr:hypothetical protein RLEG12_09585 [Rhizobium leguminosarum bv. trifolii CB782]